MDSNFDFLKGTPFYEDAVYAERYAIVKPSFSSLTMQNILLSTLIQFYGKENLKIPSYYNLLISMIDRLEESKIVSNDFIDIMTSIRYLANDTYISESNSSNSTLKKAHRDFHHRVLPVLEKFYRYMKWFAKTSLELKQDFNSSFDLSFIPTEINDGKEISDLNERMNNLKRGTEEIEKSKQDVINNLLEKTQ
jgi:hypothetical protein